MALTDKRCVPCEIGADPLSPELIEDYLTDLSGGWQVIEGKKLEKSYRFKDFQTALDFVVQVGALAEAEGHHPDIRLAWGRVVIELMTHKIKGLHDNDFILAAKIDQIRD